LRTILACLLLTSALGAQTYDLLLRGAEVIDPKNNLDRKLDMAIAGGKIAAMAPSIPASAAKQIVDVTGLVVTPGLIDIHVHVCTRSSRAAP
jgi:dihydroorotase